MVLTVLVLVALAATWQQGLLEEGINELRRYDAAAAQLPTGIAPAAIPAIEFARIPSFPPSGESIGLNTETSAAEGDIGVPPVDDFDPWTTPTLSDIDLDRLAAAVATIDTDAMCPLPKAPQSISGHAEVLRISDGCILVEYEPLSGRSLGEVRQVLDEDKTVHAVGMPPLHIFPSQSTLSYNQDEDAKGQWHLPVLDALNLWNGWPDTARVVVAVIDDGVQGNHRDLDDNVLAIGGDCHREPNGTHGTHVAGIIAAEQGNGHDVAGVAPKASILPIKVHFFDDFSDVGDPIDPTCYEQVPTLTRAIVKSILGEADIINMSLRWSQEFDPPLGLDTLETVIRIAMMRDTLVVASAGNCGDDGIYGGKRGWELERCGSHDQRNPPAMYPGVIAVASIDEGFVRDSDSTSNMDVDVAAPGVRILSTITPNNCNWFTGILDAFPDFMTGGEDLCITSSEMGGTSMAAPIVSGVLAHLLARFSELSPWTLVHALYVTADDPLKRSRISDDLGFGVVSPIEAIRWLEEHRDGLNSGSLPRVSVPVPDYSAIERTTGETPVMVIADVSGSMGETVDGQMKLDLAKESIVEFLYTMSPTREVALRSYPAAGGGECNSGELRIDFSPKTFEMEAIVLDMYADGDTPTGEALQGAVDDIRRAGFTQAEIALFSDGLANCADPCQVAKDIAASGVDIRVHVGAFIDSVEGREKLKCIARETEGSYMEGSDVESAFAAELDEFLDRNSRPVLEVTFELPGSVLPSTDPSGELQQAEAVVRNDSNVAAKDVVVVLETADGSGLTRRPVAVGNIAPEAEVAVSWSLRPGFESVGNEVGLGLSATAANTEEVVTSTGAVAVDDPNVADDAGPILGVGQIVVMGDQLLSGVGTSTRGSHGGCRRSREIGLLEVFGQRAERSVACANALIAHLAAPDWAKDVDSQVNQLSDLMEGGGAINAVVLSVGATDFGLSELARQCVLSAVHCDSEVSGTPTEVWMGGSVAGGGPQQAAASVELVRALGAVDRALNASRDGSPRTRQVPILVLAQPRAFPFVHGACFERWQGGATPLMTQPELNLYHHLVSAVNGTLEAAAVAAQELGLPVFYVGTTESAYLPDHTVCSAEPYVQSLEPLAEAGPGAIETLAERGVAGVAGEDFDKDMLVELGEEFLAPNGHGEQALANAVLRWSQSDEALDADDFVTDEFVRRSAGVASRISEPTPGETRTLGRGDRIVVESGRGLTALASGFLPGALVTASVLPGGGVVASAVADEDGTAELFVAVTGETAAGDVTLVASGVGRSGEAVSVEQPVTVLPPLRPIHSVALPALAVLLLFGSLCLWLTTRRKAIPSTPSPDETQ